MPVYQFNIEVHPQFLPSQSDPLRRVYAFAYTITIRNTGTVAAQLIARHWIIRDAHGGVQEVKGLGVIGEQPLLAPGESYQYTSGSHLNTETGAMSGSYFFVAEDGERFEQAIPMFVLDASDATTQPRVLH